VFVVEGVFSEDKTTATKQLFNHCEATMKKGITVLQCILVICIIFPASLGFAKKGGDSALVLKGKLGPDFIVDEPKKAKRLAADRVVAIPVFRGQIGLFSMLNSVTVPIKSNEKFSVSLSTVIDWVVILANSQATGSERFVAQIAMRLKTPGSSLLLLPVTAAQARHLNAGTLSLVDGLALSQHPVRANDFALTRKQLVMLALNDDNFTNVKNLYINYDAGGGILYELRPNFHWTGIYADMLDTDVRPHQIWYNNYNFQLDSNTTEPFPSRITTSCAPWQLMDFWRRRTRTSSRRTATGLSPTAWATG
jgi:hypothetical protein